MMRLPDPLAPTPEFQARVLAGRERAEQGDFHGAEVLFRTLLSEARGRQPGNHARALASLATLYGRAGRYFQARCLAAGLAALARAAGPAAEATLAFALAKGCGALSQLRLAEPLSASLAELRSVLDRQPEPLPNLELEYHVASAARASHVGDVLRARAHIESYRRTLAAVRVPEAVYRWALTMADGRILLAEGRAAEAREMVRGLGSDVPAPAFAPLHGLVLEVEVHAALGEREHARRQGRQALDLLAAIDRDAFLAADFVHQGDLLARALEGLGEVDLCHRAYDLMAVAVLVTLKQADDCLRELPELGLAESECRGALARFRKQFRRDQSALLARVATLLSRRADGRLRSLLEHPGREGFLPICAWCESVRTSEGAWLPLGHFIPREGPFEVTHGICPPCAAGLRN